MWCYLSKEKGCQYLFLRRTFTYLINNFKQYLGKIVQNINYLFLLAGPSARAKGFRFSDILLYSYVSSDIPVFFAFWIFQFIGRFSDIHHHLTDVRLAFLWLPWVLVCDIISKVKHFQRTKYYVKHIDNVSGDFRRKTSCESQFNWINWIV